MDIYGAQKSIEKLLRYVQGVADAKPNMYMKSKDRLKDLASTCTQVVELISYILQDEVLAIDMKEFSDASSSVATAVDNMQTQIDKLHEFSSPHILDYDKDDNSQVFRTFKTALKKASSIRSGFQEIDNCSKLLNDWFVIRFIKNTADSKFKYNMKKFSDWIRCILILYGHSLHTNTYDKFIQEFYSWLNTLSDTSKDSTLKYAVPYPVYKLDKHLDKNLLCLESVVLWDVLLDQGLNMICKSNSEYYCTSDSIYSLCDAYRPDCLDDYRYYKDHPEIFETLGWNASGLSLVKNGEVM